MKNSDNVDEEYIKCNKCGEKNLIGSTVCKKCGNILVTEEKTNNKEIEVLEEPKEEEEEDEQETKIDNWIKVILKIIVALIIVVVIYFLIMSVIFTWGFFRIIEQLP